MRIGLVIYGSLDTVSGGFLYDRMLVEHLEQHGDSVEIVSLPWRRYLTLLADNFSGELARRLTTANFDLLLQDELNHPSLFLLNARLRSRLRYPIISIVHHLRSSEPRAPWKNKLYGLVERRYLYSVDGFIFNSATTQQTVAIARGSVVPAVIAPPAGNRFGYAQPDPAHLRRQIDHHAHTPGPLRLLFVGNLSPRKGLHTLLNALGRLTSHNWKLDIVGSQRDDIGYSLAMQRIVARSPWRKQVKFWGSLKQDALADRFAASHLLVVPSAYEGFGIVYLEGMGFGLPAIATTAGAAHELIEHGRNGFLIEPDDHEHLTDIITHLIYNRNLLAELSYNALDRFIAHPSWEDSCARVRQFLQQFV